MLSVERLLVASDSYAGFIQNELEIVYQFIVYNMHANFDTCMQNGPIILIIFVNNIIVELSSVSDTLPASLPTIKWPDGLAQYANNTLSSGETGADLKIQSCYVCLLSIAMFSII